MTTPVLPSFTFPDLAGRVIVLTGAAQGIGRVLAHGLAVQGVRLVLIDCDTERLNGTVEEIKTARPEVEITSLHCDLADPAQRLELARTIREKFSAVDGLVHNAAISPRQPIDKVSLDFFRTMMATNVEPAVELTRELLPALRQGGQGRIVLFGSVTFELGTGLLSSYVATKGAMVGLTRSLAHELGNDNITVNCIAPGAISTEREEAVLSTERSSAVINTQSIKRRLVPADLLAPVCLLLSDAGSAITGQVITVDGGLTHTIASPEFQQIRLSNTDE